MNRLQQLKQRASRKGVIIVRSASKPGFFDIEERGCLRGLTLTRREAPVVAAFIAAHPPVIRVYVDIKGDMAHRFRCEKVRSNATAKLRCRCQYLAVNQPEPAEESGDEWVHVDLRNSPPSQVICAGKSRDDGIRLDLDFTQLPPGSEAQVNLNMRTLFGQ